ncbi:aspartyl-phosphate phosphatase Spo0E family protein [Pelosinus sp. UFO1]|uniref:aspartyl-phosphate phosphatase Spo0E family protein n=1 Tax=Pelosinus sp. UFO1 TaxID=484770 RepID=UPI0004D177D3|nr:aspartyl-phosphate phosphatase Spo0E family protein [Pelosinus sp. UFO1]AIF54244.1 Sporulation stage 0, Spo0E-like regulatory phosphatase [Pelosinus sp. UFO1]
MSNLQKLAQEIERVRVHLHELVDKKSGNLIDKEVAAVSIALDQLIVQFEKAKNQQ